MLEAASRMGINIEPPQVWQAPANCGRARQPPPSPVLQPLPQQPAVLVPLAEADVSLVSYTGSQCGTAQFQTKRKIEARATKSEMGSILGWG